MKKHTVIPEWIVGFLTILPFIYLGSIYSGLPDIVPVHFNIEGKPDAYGGKSTLIFTTGLLSVVAAGCYLLVKNIPKIDPKKSAGLSPELSQKMAISIVVFMCALNIVIIYSTVNLSVNVGKIILPLLGLLFAFLGNYMHSIKPNYFAGIRTPWALENKDNWRETHLLAGKLWVAGGVLITILTLLLPAFIGFICFMCITVALAVIPFIFSYRYFKKHQQ